MPATATATAEPLTDATAYDLARLADVAAPDSCESAGAGFLVRVRTDVGERMAELLSDGVTPSDAASQLLDDGTADEIADAAVPVYTVERWDVMRDLHAYAEDTEGLGDGSTDLTERAGVILYVVARRLVAALLDEAATQ